MTFPTDLKIVNIRPPSPKEKPTADLLREIANAIEAGVHGEVESVQVALVILGEKISVAGMNVDGTEAHYLLACGMRRFEEPALRKGL